ncbi:MULTISPECIES: hypothetical protein [Tatumella]|uniref:Uncharacterized protein n=1 Tax=Tatumella punctata TaxID=399969 RepID=A0ABW1VPV9_9GAMM|nr:MULTISPECIES: hypothetical protein [unclassified Tatumella]MBS0855846.1 hypothetical protein [Tatumella sp. JGM16]MBS0894793.1 hypothetical protein [Tatumella sp. JGM130]MBS0912754.1 hypothetical protein [Tatumella sp. JGM91]
MPRDANCATGVRLAAYPLPVPEFSVPVFSAAIRCPRVCLRIIPVTLNTSRHRQ